MAVQGLKIAILDSHACDFDGLSWDNFRELGEVAVYPRTSRGETAARAKDADAIIVNKVAIDAAVIADLPKLRYVGVTATGVNNVDLKAAAARGVTVTNVPAYGTAAVAQMVFAYLLHHFSKVHSYSELARSGAWSQSADFCLHDAPLGALAEKTIGVIGFGAIGRKVSEIAASFGMRTLVAAVPGRSYPASEQRFTIEETLRQSDVVTLHCALSEATRKIINLKTLSYFKNDAVLINTARGSLVDEDALAEVLSAGKLAAFYADVLSEEPPPPRHVLLRAPRVHMTPHVAWATREARIQLMTQAFENLRAFADGKPRNVVSG